jgi:tape measure domain-containing protein
MATLRELIVKIAFKIDDAVLRKSTAKTNEILSKQKKSFEKTEEAITKSKQKETEKRVKAEQRENDARTRMQMRYLKWKEKEMARHAMLEKRTEQAKSRSFQEGMTNLQSFGTKAIATAAAIQAAFVAVAFAIIKVNDQINMGVARVQTATGGSKAQARGRFKELLGLSTQTGQDVETITSLHNKIQMSAVDLNANPESTMRAVRTVSKLAIMGGTPKASQQGGLLQLGQALGSARVQADEYRSVVEQLPALHQAIAKSMGMTASKLQSFIKDARKTGSITGRELFDAILKAEEDATKAFEKFPITFQRIQNKFMNSFLQLGLALEDQLEPANRFFQNLYDKMDFLNKFLIKNKEVVGKVIKVIFKTLEKALDGIILVLDKLQPAMDWINKYSGAILKIVKDMEPALIAITSAILLLVVGFDLFNKALKVFQGIMWVLNLDPKIRVFTALAMAVIYLETKFGLLSKTIKATLGLLDQFKVQYDETVPYIGGIGGPPPVEKKKEIMPGFIGSSKPLTSNLPKGYSQGQFFQSPTTKNVKINNVFHIKSTNPQEAANKVASIFHIGLGGALQ